MKYNLFFLTVFFMSTFCYSQENSKDIERAHRKNKLSQQGVQSNQLKEKTITLYLKGLSKNAQGQIKDEILLYKQKIISLSLDETTETMVITYNTILPKEKIDTILKKYGYQQQNTSDNQTE